MRVDLASLSFRQTKEVRSQQLITWRGHTLGRAQSASNLDLHGESVLDSPRPSKTQSVPPSSCALGLVRRSSLAASEQHAARLKSRCQSPSDPTLDFPFGWNSHEQQGYADCEGDKGKGALGRLIQKYVQEPGPFKERTA